LTVQPVPVQVDIYRTAIPMRRFEHAAASRDVAEAVVLRLELSDPPAGRGQAGGAVGWGETLPRPYVTGETLETVPRDVEQLLWEAARRGDPQGKDLPAADGGRPITAARCAVELALGSACERSGLHVAPGMPGGAFPSVRVSGVLGAADPGRTASRLRRMRWYGLRDFKLKLGFGQEVDGENLRLVHRRIGKAVAEGKCTLRVDVNGGWRPDETPDRVAALKPRGVCVVEQPVFGPPEARLSKNGGIWPCLSMAEAAAEAGVPFVIGCMVGESSILSAAQRRLLWRCPLPRFVEGNYDKFLLADDLTARSLRFGYGGKIRSPLRGLHAAVDPRRLRRYGRLIQTLRA